MRASDVDDAGLTLIEVLVVLLILGVLAAIAVPVFLGQQRAAEAALLEADLTSARGALVAYRADDHALYTDDAARLADYGYPRGSAALGPVVLADGGAAFCVQGSYGGVGPLRVTDGAGASPGTCPV